MLPTTKSVPDKHSPGPWIVDPDDPLSIVCPALSTPTLWEEVAECSDETGRERALADARLIAAAPDLLSALKAVQPEMRREHDAGDGHFSTAEVEAVEAAIAKAEGKDE